jgi:hypothetical protein
VVLCLYGTSIGVGHGLVSNSLPGKSEPLNGAVTANMIATGRTNVKVRVWEYTEYNVKVRVYEYTEYNVKVRVYEYTEYNVKVRVYEYTEYNVEVRV